MPSVERRENTDTEDTEATLPDGTETVIWAATGSGFNLGNVSDYPEECFPDDLDLSPVPSRVEGTTEPTITFEPGDEIPLPVAEDQWPDWNDRMAALDSDGNRLDSTGGHSFDPGAVEKWRFRNK